MHWCYMKNWHTAVSSQCELLSGKTLRLRLIIFSAFNQLQSVSRRENWLKRCSFEIIYLPVNASMFWIYNNCVLKRAGFLKNLLFLVMSFSFKYLLLLGFCLFVVCFCYFSSQLLLTIVVRNQGNSIISISACVLEIVFSLNNSFSFHLEVQTELFQCNQIF